mgnify:FL=1
MWTFSVAALFTSANAVYSGCSDEESQGIAQCESPGEGFFFDQAKAARCPDRGTWDYASWSCDDWKCHMYCSDTSSRSERKSCDNCPEVAVSLACFESQTAACKNASLTGCDINCNYAGRRQFLASLLMSMLTALGLLSP